MRILSTAFSLKKDTLVRERQLGSKRISTYSCSPRFYRYFSTAATTSYSPRMGNFEA